MVKKRCLELLVALLTAFVAFGVVLPAFAQVHEPDVSFSINQVEAYRNCLELNDQLYLITIEPDYTTNPTYGSGIDDTFIIRLMSGAVELAATTAYPYFDDGYDLGVVAIYFDATSAPAWNGAYTVELKGNPTLYWLDDTATVAMQGAVAYDGGVYTDETAAANDAAANDMTLLPAVPAVDDAYYFGGDGMFDILTVNIGQQGDWAGTYTWEYWDGAEWTILSGLSDATVGFTAGIGNYDVTYTCPEDWQQSVVDGITAHWIRFRVVTYTAVVAQPLGTQSWVNPAAVPVTATSSFSLWYDGGTVAATVDRLTTRMRSVAQTLENDWGGTIDLIETVAGVGKLTGEGEDYFVNAIPGLRSMCPDLFSDILTSPEFVHTLVVGESATEGADTDSDTFGNNWFAQTFTPTTTFSITGCDIEVYRFGGPGNVTVAIRATAAGLPTGADLVSVTIDGNVLTESVTGEWFEVSFTADQVLTAGTTYAIVVRAPGGGAINHVAWRSTSGTTALFGSFYYIGSSLIPGGVFFVGSSAFAAGWLHMGAGAMAVSYYGGGQACVSADAGVTWAPVATGMFDFMFTTRAREGFTLSYRDQLAGRLVGTPLDFTRLGSFLRLSRMWASAIIWMFGPMLLVIIASVRAAKSYKPATLVAFFMLPIGALAGFIYLEVAIVGAMFCALAAVYVFFFSRAG